MIVGISIWLCAISPVADILMKGLESGLEVSDKVQGDVIILLGGGVVEGVPDYSGVGRPTDSMLARIVTAVRLQRRLRVPIVVSGGRVLSQGIAEAPVVRRVLVDLGVSDSLVILEPKSRDTHENARYTRDICEKRGFVAPILVTSAFHTKRAILSYRQAGLKVTPFPVGFYTYTGKVYHWDDYLPTHGSLSQTARALKEYLGMVFYRLAY